MNNINQLNNMVQSANLCPQVNSGVWGFSGNNGFFIIGDIRQLEGAIAQTNLATISGKWYPNQCEAYQAISQEYLRKYFSIFMSEKPYIPSLNEFLQNGSAYIAIRSFVKPILMPNYCKCYKLFSNNRCILTEQISNIVSLIVQYNLLDVTIVEYGSFDKAKKDMMVDIACKQYTHDKNAMFIPADLTMNKSYEL